MSGNLTLNDVLVKPVSMIYYGKSITGFYLPRWLKTLSEEEKQKYFRMVADDLKDGCKIFGSTVLKTMELKDWKQAIEESANVASDGGKILINCG